jgi:hypothetical protein
MISSFEYTDPNFSILSPTYSVSYGSSSSLIDGQSIRLSTLDNALYMSGSLNNRLALFKFERTDGTSQWVYSLKDTAAVSTTVKMARFELA